MSEVCAPLSFQDHALLSASQANMPHTIYAAIKEGANVNVKRCDGWSSLMFSVWYGYLANVKVLIENGADVHAVNAMGHSVLFLAAQQGWLEVVDLLLKKGASTDCTDADGDTPITAAEHFKHFAVADFLREYNTNK